MSGFFILICLIAILFAWNELSHRLRPSCPLKMRSLEWEVERDNEKLRLTGWIQITNPNPKIEVMIPELKVTPTFLGGFDTRKNNVNVELIAKHTDEQSRSDGYWFAYIVKSLKSTKVKIKLDLEGIKDKDRDNNRSPTNKDMGFLSSISDARVFLEKLYKSS